MTETERTKEFTTHRSVLFGLAYRMLGRRAEAEDIVQESWIRWEQSDEPVANPRGYLSQIVTRLCLNHINCAHHRKEEHRCTLPDPLAPASGAADDIAAHADTISMAFLVVLQQLGPAERAVLLLHEVLGFKHEEIGEILQRTAANSRQLLKRARQRVQSRPVETKADAGLHARLLTAFAAASSAGDVQALVELLTQDAVLTADAPSGTRFGNVRNLGAPLHGARAIARFSVAAMAGGTGQLRPEVRQLNGRPALVLVHDGAAHSAVMLEVVQGKIQQVFVFADPKRLARLGARRSSF